MNSTAAIVLAVIGLTVLAYVIRYVINTVFNKAGDAISNKLVERKNEKPGNQEEKLSDRYK